MVNEVNLWITSISCICCVLEAALYAVYNRKVSIIFHFMNMITNVYAIQLHPWLRILGEEIAMDGQKKTQLN